jgi:hypothetical protein
MRLGDIKSGCLGADQRSDYGEIKEENLKAEKQRAR